MAGGVASPRIAVMGYDVGGAAALAFILRLRGTLIAQRFAWACLGLFFAALLSLLAVESSRPAATPANTRQPGAANR